jgi:uncharacterized SAM-binding protein YcdF (DUF218 family)
VKTLLALALIALAWVAGLVAFAARVAASTPAPDPPRVDAIVALTGGSVKRIEAAADLLQRGYGRRLLISGVNRGSTRAEVKGAIRPAGRAFDCCVDLGFRAQNTEGNAEETAAWARYHRYRSLIVVTADFHMPRAILELRTAMPDLRLVAYPVATEALDARRWWAEPEDARRMIVEYCKYLVIRGRQAVLGLVKGRQSTNAAAPDTAPDSVKP